MKKNKISINITLTNSILGSLPGNKDICQDFIASKGPTVEGATEEVACVKETLEKGTTVFARDDKGLFMWDYQFKGFLKEAIGVMTECGDVSLTKWTFKRAVDSCVFVTPRRIYFLDPQTLLPYKEAHGFCERPLRAETMQGDRVALARSELLKEGTVLKPEITLLESTNAKSKFSALSMETIQEALNYGALKGLGQWRNGGYGSFEWKEAK